MPDPFVLVLLLTLVALVLGWAKIGGPPLTLIKAWTDGFGNAEILKFGLQIILIVVTGEAIAASRFMVSFCCIVTLDRFTEIAVAAVSRIVSIVCSSRCR